MNFSRRRACLACVLLLVALVGCSSSDEPSSDGPLEMIDSPVPGERSVTLTAESDGRERAVGNIRAQTAASVAKVTILGAEVRGGQNVVVGDVRLVRLSASGGEFVGTGYPIPPLPGDDGYEWTSTAWAASSEAVGSIIEPDENINLIVGLAQPDASRCGVINGIDVLYEADGVEYVETWNTGYVIETTLGAGCESVGVTP